MKFRNAMQKKGRRPLYFGAHQVQRLYLDGHLEVETVDPVLRFRELGEEDALAVFEHGIEHVHRVIEEAHEMGFVDFEQKPHRFAIEYLLQTPCGGWEYFDPPNLGRGYFRPSDDRYVRPPGPRGLRLRLPVELARDLHERSGGLLQIADKAVARAIGAKIEPEAVLLSDRN